MKLKDPNYNPYEFRSNRRIKKDRKKELKEKTEKELIKEIQKDETKKDETKKDETNKIRNKRKLNQKLNFLRQKIKNLVNEMHFKTCKYITNNYNIVIIGKLSTKGIINKKDSTLSPMMKQACLNIKHFEFRQRLKAKCEEYNVNYIEIKENMTSRTCCNCGNVKVPFSDKTYNCEKCKIIMDRDHNSALNMIIKAKTDNLISIHK